MATVENFLLHLYDGEPRVVFYNVGLMLPNIKDKANSLLNLIRNIMRNDSLTNVSIHEFEMRQHTFVFMIQDEQNNILYGLTTMELYRDMIPRYPFSEGSYPRLHRASERARELNAVSALLDMKHHRFAMCGKSSPRHATQRRSRRKSRRRSASR
jgi:hypothetical protein